MSISVERFSTVVRTVERIALVVGAIVLPAFVGPPLPAQEYVWAERVAGSPGSLGTDRGYSVAVDAAGNVLTTGYFSGTADFDPGPGTYDLTSAGDYDAFVSKLDGQGHLVWARRIGSYDTDQSWSVATVSGSVYLAGRFRSTVDFDPDPSVDYPLNCGWGWETFLLKLDGSGNFVWAKCIGAVGGAAEPISMVLGATGELYVAGSFQGTVDFDPDPVAVYNLTPPSGTAAMFVAKYDGNGGFVWARQMGGVFSENLTGIAVDNGGNVYSTGYFLRTVDFDPGSGVHNLTSLYKTAVFVQKLDASGSFVWVKQLGGGSDAATAANASSYAIAVEGDGTVYTTGSFQGTADFDPDPIATYNLTSPGSESCMFVSKLDAAGNLAWARCLGGASAQAVPSAIVVDGSRNVYTSGQFANAVDFDPGAGTYTLTSRYWDIFVSKLDAGGDFVSAVGLGGTSEERASAIALDRRGNIYTTGYFYGTADFVPGPGLYNLTSAGDADVFASKLAQTPTLSFADRTTLGWRPVFGEAAYNIYRSDSGLPGTFSCLAGHATSPATIDLDVPASGDLFAYLVTTIDVAGEEGTLGSEAVNGTPTTERPNVSSCP